MAQALKFGDIKESCSSLTNLASSMDGTIDTIDSSISKIQNPAWEGKAAQNFQEKIKTLANNLPDANKQLALSVVFLASCADAYEELGEDSVKKIKELLGGQEAIDKYDPNATETTSTETPVDTTTLQTQSTADAGNNTTSQNTSCGGCGGCGGCGSSSSSSTPTSDDSRYTYTVGGGQTSQDGVYTSTIVSSPETKTTLTGLKETDMTGKEIEIPTDVKQDGYAVNGYDYWINSGKEMEWEAGTDQKTVADIWKDQGAVFKNGIAVINVEGKDRYIVAVSPKYGKVGDCLDVKLADGTIIPCVIGDTKDVINGAEWGSVKDNGSVSILEFEVQRSQFLQSGNPTTDKWKLPWDSTLDVKSIKNTGSVIGATKAEKTTTTDTTTTSPEAVTVSNDTTDSITTTTKKNNIIVDTTKLDPSGTFYA